MPLGGGAVNGVVVGTTAVFFGGHRNSRWGFFFNILAILSTSSRQQSIRRDPFCIGVFVVSVTLEDGTVCEAE